ncbi:hypothetical protein A2303_01645 [Candidatus Falkowbacteria bacterium RIFOXYB2_FULL_47_14]|uniref:NADH-ubiquinone oxidoreductase 51kDa subunit iron-sulphur binding domain-containing protein n=1 Tax=Candidatus Falkowbacteria bacterium RIFOXYA2_FULL_47_19 TaxID=1797994 RepID=A0A1F5SLK3_9BACT|nr:MAG: hypothetical protein A2227_01720 [Candidatus Falkowbacteria bacterium RIFOXYA2_FULL_47_19]OGF34793.1 MAG: hypothetical protein A2468_03615 [Candidatus Falkowbacteria bacterium RIFOXYC2_FULL_46_15]OGF43484.1 MAG: hypothetical protein A2303_01645 [Candidatus Falkowbacteria bacterium RIFOXYB2_FULL_47_14]
MPNIIIQIKKAGLVGRGGGGFPTGLKWEFVKKAHGSEKYVIANASEGEPGVKKDLFILENHPERFMDGMRLAIEYLGDRGRGKKKIDVKGYVYLNPRYSKNKKLVKKLKQTIGSLPVTIFNKPKTAGYAGGEETSVLNGIEGKRVEPRLRPPFPPTNGLWNSPTLVNNVETFYDVSLAAAGEYKGERFYTINGDCLWTGVYRFPSDWTIEKILKKTDNYPGFDFFIQVGGDGSGVVLNSKQLKRPAVGSGSITVYSAIKHDPMVLIKKWADFFRSESCGQCTPCREGTFRLRELLGDKNTNWQMLLELLNNLSETSFCGLGSSAPTAIFSFLENVVMTPVGERMKLPKADRKMIADCLTCKLSN